MRVWIIGVLIITVSTLVAAIGALTTYKLSFSETCPAQGWAAAALAVSCTNGVVMTVALVAWIQKHTEALAASQHTRPW